MSSPLTMTTPTTFTITPDDILVPRRSEGDSCAIARAARRALGSRFTWVSMRSLIVDGGEGHPFATRRVHREIDLLKEVAAWNSAFVAGRPVEPITFSLDIPPAPKCLSRTNHSS